MTIYVQNKDGVAFAYVETDTPIENALELDKNINPEEVLGKRYEKGEWVSAPLIYFIEKMDSNGIIIQVNSTVYSSDVTGEVIDSSIRPGFKKIEGNWIDYEQYQRELFEQQQQEDLDQKIKEAAQRIIDTRPFPSWEWNGSAWVSPIPIPETNPQNYYWDEDLKNWVEYLEEPSINPEIS